MNKHFRRMALLLSLCLLLGGCAQIMPDPVRDAASTLSQSMRTICALVTGLRPL